MTDSSSPKADSAKTDSASPPPPPAPAPAADQYAVLTGHHQDQRPGALVRGTAAQVAAVIAAGKARRANEADIGLAGGRFFTLK